jgi:DNA modification methylase
MSAIVKPFFEDTPSPYLNQNINRNFIGFELNSEYCGLANLSNKKEPIVKIGSFGGSV